MTNPIPQILNETLNRNTTEHHQQCQEQEAPPTTLHSNSQSPKTLTVPNSDPDSANPNEGEDTLMEDPTEIQHVDDPEPDATTPSASAAPFRRGPKRKKLGPKRTAQERKSREKLQVLLETLKPIPFVPAKALDFESHKSLLQRLGLWDFVHVEFDSSLRGDLLAQLIASYVPSSRCSYVNGVRMRVNRTDLGRALKLPVKKVAAAVVLIGEDGEEELDLRESVAFVLELVSNWMLLHDDTYIIPNEVLGYLNLIKEGHLEKVDWAGLIWNMLDKELKAPQLVNCYYASHLQCMIKMQHGELLEEAQLVEVEEGDEGEEAEVKDEGEEAEVKDGGEEAEVKDGGEEAEVKAGGEEAEGDEAEGKAEGDEAEGKAEGDEDEGKAEGDEAEGKVEGEEAEVKDEVDEVEVKDEEEDGEEEEEGVGDKVDGNGDVRMGGVDESRILELEEHNIELSLGQDNVERVEVEKDHGGGEQMMDFEQTKEEEPGMWLLDQKNSVGEPFLRACHSIDVKGMDCGQLKEDEGEEGEEQEDEDEDAEEEDEHEGGFHLSPKCIPLEGMPSGTGSLIQAMEAGHMPFSSAIDLRDNSVGDFLSSRDAQMISGSSLFGNGHKRDLGLDNPNSHNSLNGSNKRLRSDSPWNSKPVDFEMCMEQIEHWMGKARMMYEAKDQACEESRMNQELLLNELQKRDNVIEHFHKAKMEDGRKREVEVYRFEKELFMMTSLVDGYRKALKETQKAFAEYRARCPQADEPLYKDVPGSGGLVLSVMELEKERLKKEEEERTKLREFLSDFEKKSRDIEATWFGKLEGHLSIVESLGNRLLAIEDQVKHLNEVNAKCKVSGPTECTPTSEGQTA